ncbi:RICIN domain-containing protein [Kitasatospora sp. NPDC048540]|uniref:RICIN domain-containing protein n=1 Tax=Kitasatospora sp. NPDC048540 TaxID=3155634 RepID=UPI0033CC456B
MKLHKRLAVAAAAVAVAMLAPGVAQAAGSETGHQGPTASRQVNLSKAEALTGQAASAQGTALRSGALTGLYVRIHSLYSKTPGQCLDVDIWGKGANGSKIQTWTCNNSPQQEWIYWSDGSLESVKFPGMCLDADTNGNGKDGNLVQLYKCNGWANQRWYHPSGDLAIYNVRFNNNNTKVLDRDATQPGDGAKAQLWTKNFASQQWWEIRTA